MNMRTEWDLTFHKIGKGAFSFRNIVRLGQVEIMYCVLDGENIFTLESLVSRNVTVQILQN